MRTTLNFFLQLPEDQDNVTLLSYGPGIPQPIDNIPRVGESVYLEIEDFSSPFTRFIVDEVEWTFWDNSCAIAIYLREPKNLLDPDPVAVTFGRGR
jgi:hypothetical protein